MVSVQELRPPAPEDRDRVRRLDDAARAHDGFPSLTAAEWRDLEAPSAASTGLLAVAAGEPVGYAHLSASDTLATPHFVAGVVVAPGHRAEGTVTRALVDAMRREIADRGGGRIVLWVTGADDAFDALVSDAGFRRIGEQFQMRMALPLAESPKWPPGIEVRTFVPGTDDDAWRRVNNRAFRDHPDQGNWSEATLRSRMAEPWFDPEGFLLAFDPAGLAGFCWTKVHEAPSMAAPAPSHPDSAYAAPGTDPRLGEIYVIGVDPDRHGTGLGRALTVAGLEHLHHARGCETGMLYVDAANAPGLGLYRALGFAVHRTDRSYELEVPAP